MESGPFLWGSQALRTTNHVGLPVLNLAKQTLENLIIKTAGQQTKNSVEGSLNHSFFVDDVKTYQIHTS